jgi:ribosomal subunit interface protein
MATNQLTFRIHFQDVDHDEEIREGCEASARDLQQQFPETAKYEFTLTHTGDVHEAHVHVTGKELAVASSAQAETLAESLTEALDKARRQLRKHHDKVIFERRRKAARTRP